jgi:hypothetical protein
MQVACSVYHLHLKCAASFPGCIVFTRLEWCFCLPAAIHVKRNGIQQYRH